MEHMNPAIAHSGNDHERTDVGVSIVLIFGAVLSALAASSGEMPAIISLVENGETAQIVDSETADGQIRKLARARGEVHGVLQLRAVRHRNVTLLLNRRRRSHS